MIVASLLLKNEAAPDRYLRRVLQNCRDLCDKIVVVDDGSVDDTAAVCQEFGATVIRRANDNHTQNENNRTWFGHGERSARALLWEKAAEVAGPDGWLYFADGDHELVGLDRADFAKLCRATHVSCWAFPLWDCWNDDSTMRVDGFWKAHEHPRPWLFRAQPVPSFVPAWPEREIHTGHAPANFPVAAGLAPPLCGIRHLGYISAEHRRLKHQRYLALAG